MHHTKLNILIADDDPAICDSFRAYLTDQNHHVDIALNGSNAYHFERKNKYDLAFIDANMPVMDGVDCTKAIRECSESIYIVLMSGCISHREAAAALMNGANAFLSKPFPMASVNTHVNAVLSHAY